MAQGSDVLAWQRRSVVRVMTMVVGFVIVAYVIVGVGPCGSVGARLRWGMVVLRDYDYCW